MVKMTTNQENMVIIMFFDPENMENEVLHKILALLVPEMLLLAFRMAAILNIAIYNPS